jgi:serine protease
MNRNTLILAAALAAALCGGIVDGASSSAAVGVSRARAFVPHQVIVKFRGKGPSRAVALREGVGVHRAAATLRRRPDVAYATPNYIATASGQNPLPPSGIPNDPGPLEGDGGVPGGWVSLQWNFLPWEGTGSAALPTAPGGINAVGAWRNLMAAERRGARGVTVAVLDTGIAYRSHGKRFRRSPDFSSGQFVRGYDFVGRDQLPLDENGHGTHVAGTIAEKTNNGVALAGLAYRAKLMPVRVLDRNGSGQADDIALGIRYAVQHGADVINMSFNFGCGKRVPGINEELRAAYHAGVVTVASVGNLGSETCIAPPATGPRVIGVGGSTEGGCLGSYSLRGKGVDVLAPGGGTPAPGCPSVSAAPIYQVTFRGGNPRDFGEPGSYVGTSMAAAHVSGVAAMVLASNAVDTRHANPARRVTAVSRRLTHTARSLGLSRLEQGSGLIDADRATNPSVK